MTKNKKEVLCEHCKGTGEEPNAEKGLSCVECNGMGTLRIDENY
jgi:DnaJ-class molecular chaperone